jgi:hypothetical protein
VLEGTSGVRGRWARTFLVEGLKALIAVGAALLLWRWGVKT